MKTIKLTRTQQKLTPRYVKAAQEMSREGEIEVDDNADVSFGDDDGAYVAAWLWIPAEKLEKV